MDSLPRFWYTPPTMNKLQLAESLIVLRGAVNTGVLIDGDRALLLDCGDRVTPERLAELGVATVECICATQHRRTALAGAGQYVAQGARLIAPAGQKHLLEDPDAYWNNPANRWHLYHVQPGPLVTTEPLPVARGVADGDAIEWAGHTIRVLDTPGATDGSVSYLLEIEGKTFCFCGDALYGPGQVWDLHSLQKGVDGMTDYHGFMGNARKLIPSLEKIVAGGADVLVPTHGQVMDDPPAAVRLTIERIEAVQRNFAAISCLHWYFAGFLAPWSQDPERMSMVETADPPEFVLRAGPTCFALRSETGAALITDCGHQIAIDALKEWLTDGTVTSIDGCWVTHYHDDHVDSLPALVEQIGCPILTDEHMAEILEHPERFFLPCISPAAVPVTRATRDGESWQWHEFKLTAFHFPGQTLYHSGLLAEGRGMKVFFAGDSGGPTGIDDHCCGNRNLLGEGKGFRRCVRIWRETRPDHIFNQHQERPYHFTEEQLDTMDRNLAERERLMGELLPWEHPNFGIDENWVRSYPYEQDASRGESIEVEVHFTNHGPAPAAAAVEPVLPPGWTLPRKEGLAPKRSEGACPSFRGPAEAPGAPQATIPPNEDGAVKLRLTVGPDAAAKKTVLPIRITWNGRYLGPFRHAIVNVP